MNPQKMRDTLVALYLDWVNNYLTRGKMASDYGLSPVMLAYMIDQGQMIHEERAAATRAPGTKTCNTDRRENDTAARDRAEELLAKHCIGEEVSRTDLIRWWAYEDDAVWSWIERSVSPSPAIISVYDPRLRCVRIA